jgi:type IV pilus assembly protein PilY1
MKQRKSTFGGRPVALAAALALFGHGSAALAQLTDLASVPLVNAASVDMLPNIMFILDDSGSMSWNHMPDFVVNSYCRGSSSLIDCEEGHPPFYANAFNKAYYNPEIDYAPPKNANGTSKTSYTTWTSVPRDGYGIQSTSSTDLVNNYPDLVACKDWSDNVNGANCKALLDATNNYAYPNGTYDTLKTKYGAPFYYTATVEWCKNRAASYPRFGTTSCQAKKTSVYQYVKYSNWKRVDIVPTTTSYPGADGGTRTYAQEMTNFANWYAWYRTRMQMMKSAVSRAFTNIRGNWNESDPTDKDYFHARVGFTTISETTANDGALFLKIDAFDTTHKGTWFNRMVAVDPSSWTPLRGALSKAGKIYAGKLGPDPVQYSCQRNFTILSTDGYWNTNAEVSGSTSSSYGPDKLDNTDVGDQDGNSPPTNPPSYDAKKKSNTLADVAYYYYHTDLRTSALGNCTNGPRPDGSTGDVCNNEVPPSGSDTDVDDVASHQHMSTFTVGLGVDGTLTYRPDYKTASSGDYFDILQGTKQWPDPILNTAEERIDDLWHAAVNGRGTYFSAADPASLVSGLNAALTAMETTKGAGAAAATGSLQPTEGEVGSDKIYVATYRTNFWDGDVSAHTIDLATGAVSATPDWQAGALLDARITSSSTDTRTIYAMVDGTRKLFTYANLNTTQKAYFDNTKLSQYDDWTSAERTVASGAAGGELLLNFLRGHYAYEDQAGNDVKLYRDREHVLGDIVHSQPIYVKKSSYSFGDGHDPSFGGRMGMLYSAANDGMLHAFCTETAGSCTPGRELWAFVIPPVMKDLWYLADKKHASEHRYFVDGPMAASDVFIGGSWKTILVGSLGKGGRGYYAMNITDPSNPELMWTFTAEGPDGVPNTPDDNPNVGFTYGAPLITKIDADGDGTGENNEWRVLVSSGYNNVPNLPITGDHTASDGGGYLFVLDAATGIPMQTIATGNGTAASPSGLARIQARVPDLGTDNTTLEAYGGDLYGDMWRFDFAGAGSATKVIGLGSSRPIMVAPEIGEVSGTTALFFGTGRFLGKSDLDDGASQVILGVRADAANLTLGDLVEQTGSITIDWAGGNGWYRMLTGGKERVHLSPQLFLGTLMFATVLPEATECRPGGSSRLYFVNYKNGTKIGSNPLYYEYSSPLVGVSFVSLPGKKLKVYGMEGAGTTPIARDFPIDEGGGTKSGDSGTRIMWRELVD